MKKDGINLHLHQYFQTTREDFDMEDYCVKRRYNDFLWLREQLKLKHPLLIIAVSQPVCWFLVVTLWMSSSIQGLRLVQTQSDSKWGEGG